MKKDNYFLQTGGNTTEDYSENLSTCWSAYPTNNQKTQNCMAKTVETEGVQPLLEGSIDNHDTKAITTNYMNDIFNSRISDNFNTDSDSNLYENKKLLVAKKKTKISKKKSPADKKKSPAAKKKSPAAKKKSPVAKKKSPAAKKKSITNNKITYLSIYNNK